MTNIKLPLLRGRIAQYSFGYSEYDDIDTVTNWQEGDNTFTNVPDGRWYFFAKPKSTPGGTFLRRSFDVNVDITECSITLYGFKDVTPNCQITLSGFQDLTVTNSEVFSFNLISGINV